MMLPVDSMGRLKRAGTGAMVDVVVMIGPTEICRGEVVELSKVAARSEICVSSKQCRSSGYYRGRNCSNPLKHYWSMTTVGGIDLGTIRVHKSGDHLPWLPE